MNAFDRFLHSHGTQFEIYRDGQLVCKTDGLPNTEESSGKKYVGFKPGTDIEIDDLIINTANEKFYICDKMTEFVHKEPFQIKAYTISESRYKQQIKQNNQPIFNIGEVHSSIVGTQQNVTVNNGYSAEYLNTLIDQHDSLDKELLKEMVSILETAISSQEPIRKGLLSKFAGILQRNEWITAPIASFIFEKFFL